MSLKRCPGSLAFAQPKIEFVRCPHCKADVEIWSDEADAKCPQCERMVIRLTRQSCVDWCKYSRECLGNAKYKQYVETKAAMRKQALLQAADDLLGNNDARKLEARNRLALAERMLAAESSADPNVLLAAAVFLGETAAGGAVAEQALRDALDRLGYPAGFVNEVAGLASAPMASVRADSPASLKVLHDVAALAPLYSDAGGGARDFAALAARLLTSGGATVLGQLRRSSR
jgi:hypothetical protein